jgi:hypothetical protein
MYPISDSACASQIYTVDHAPNFFPPVMRQNTCYSSWLWRVNKCISIDIDTLDLLGTNGRACPCVGRQQGQRLLAARRAAAGGGVVFAGVRAAAILVAGVLARPGVAFAGNRGRQVVARGRRRWSGGAIPGFQQAARAEVSGWPRFRQGGVWMR